MELMRDMIYVKCMERILRRPLTDEEMNGEMHWVLFPSGRYDKLQVPLLAFPWDLMEQPAEIFDHILLQPFESGEEESDESA